MLPITRASVDHFCVACLQVLPKFGDLKHLHHDFKNDPHLLRVFNAMASGTHSKETMNLALPKQLCHSCYTKVFVFCKFAEMSICSSIALNELTEEDHKEINRKNLKMICVTCFKIKRENDSSLLNQTELQELFSLIFIDVGFQKLSFSTVQPKSICQLCSQKSKTFLEFQRQLQESQQYYITILSNTDNLTEPSFRINGSQVTEKTPGSMTEKEDIFDNDSEPEIDNIIIGVTNEKYGPFELSDIDSKESISYNEESVQILFRRCEKCCRTFRKLPSFESHKCRHQNKNQSTDNINEVQSLFTCNTCHKDYKSEAQLRTHAYRVHCKADNKCSYCQREFKQKHHLKDHIRSVHEGIRPYKCSYCEKSFGLPKTLRVHLMGHTNERPFQCNICPKTFRQKAELNRHLKNHSADIQFRCPVCSQGKSSQKELDEHFIRHNNRDGYQCSKCGRKFSKLCHLKNHDDAVHLQLRPFKCDYKDCGKAFAARKSLQIHQLTHTGDSSNICNVCHKEFSCKANLLRHFYMHKTTFKQKTDA